MIESDVIIVGAGPVGCVLANKISELLSIFRDLHYAR